MNLIRINENPRFTRSLVAHKVFRGNPVKVCDIGCREGFASYWKWYHDQIELIGFEADMEECDRLTQKAQKVSTGFRMRFYPYALHQDCRKRKFYITNSPASSGFYPPNGLVKRLWSDEDTRVIKTVEQETINLDSLNMGFDFIKLDTEGCELDILRGAEETLKSALGVTVETEFTPMHEGQPVFRDVDQFMISHGFELFELVPYLFGRKTLPRPETIGGAQWGQVIVGQALYLRDGYELLDDWAAIKVLKLASFMELFCLRDCVIELIGKASEKYIIEKNTANRLIKLLIPEGVEYGDHTKAT